MRAACVVLVAAGCGRVAFDDACAAPFRWTATGCYAVVDSLVDWPTAKLACEDLAAHLVVIDDEAENQMISSLAPVNLRVWIGLSDLDVEMTFVWVTGEPLAYSRWAGGEPNAADQDCVELALSWNEEDCMTTNAYVCER